MENVIAEVTHRREISDPPENMAQQKKYSTAHFLLQFWYTEFGLGENSNVSILGEMRFPRVQIRSFEMGNEKGKGRD